MDFEPESGFSSQYFWFHSWAAYTFMIGCGIILIEYKSNIKDSSTIGNSKIYEKPYYHYWKIFFLRLLPVISCTSVSNINYVMATYSSYVGTVCVELVSWDSDKKNGFLDFENNSFTKEHSSHALCILEVYTVWKFWNKYVFWFKIWYSDTMKNGYKPIL